MHTKALLGIKSSKHMKKHFLKIRSKVRINVKILVYMERSCHKQCSYKIWKPLVYEFMSYRQFYFKVGQRSRSTRFHSIWYNQRGLVTGCLCEIWKSYAQLPMLKNWKVIWQMLSCFATDRQTNKKTWQKLQYPKYSIPGALDII